MSQAFSARPRLSGGDGPLSRFWLGPWYFPLLTAAAALFLLLDAPLAGLGALLLAGSLYLAFVPDLMAALYPFLLMMLLSTRYYEDGTVLLPYSFAAALPALALLLRLRLCPPLPPRPGRFDHSLLAVSAATALGGAGAIPAQEYFTPLGLYYVLGLGLLLLLLYRLFRAELGRARPYDLTRRFLALLYAAGLFTAALVADRYRPYLDFFFRELQVIYIPCRNYFANMLLLALPAPFYFLRESRVHLLGIALLAGAALLTGSRSALVFLPVIGVLCAVRCAGIRGASRLWRAGFGLLLGSAALLLTLLAAKTLFLSRATDGQLFSPADSRLTFLRLAWEDFLSHPLTGQGLANMRNSEVFLGVAGSIVWYHNYFAQILGSMGLVGAAAYGWLLRDRLRLLRRLRGRQQALGFCYLSMLLVSLTNPGEFSPLPQAALMVLLFAVAEEAVDAP